MTKLIGSLVLVAVMISGCVAGDAVSHADDPAAEKRDQGPALCQDGTAPPCVPRG
jgi:PBP1b-binding outer membrane lipoprotein LpoB